MEARDLRQWIEQVDKMGELKRVNGAHWNHEIGAITELVHRKENGPAVLFDEIPEHEKGYRLLTNSMGSLRRLAMTIGFDPTLDYGPFINAWREKISDLKPVPAVEVKDGPILDNVLEGKDINMLAFPSPKWHEHDGGRYIGTGSIDITRDPDDGWVNCGCYRVMVHDEDTLGFYISPGKQGRIMREKYFERGEPLRIAVSFGHHPIVFMAGSIEVPHGICEFDYIGGITGEPLEVIKGEYSGLPFPATAEIVIEGEVLPNAEKVEGPFGEWTGYYGSASRSEPVIKVKRLMYRDNPILLGSPPTRPPAELGFYRAFLRSALIWDQLEKAGVPDVRGVWTPVSGGSRLLIVVSIKQRFLGHARQAGHVASMCRAGAYLGRYVIVVDEDINPYDINDVMWALTTRSDPSTSIDFINRAWSGPLDPVIRKGQPWGNSRAVIDCTRPFEWIDEFPRVAESSPELRDATMRKWGDILFGD